MGALDIRHVSRAYGKTAVLHDIDISVAAGEFLVLAGPSG
jgi:ABC-type sugar transport system ATPase subunit